MKIEYEATFANVDPAEIRKRLSLIGAHQEYDEFLMKRTVFEPTKDKKAKTPNTWARVRQEASRITMSIKDVKDGNIEDQKEVELTVNSYEDACSFLVHAGWLQKAEQETKRELWVIDDVEVTIDTWPWLEPFVEIEGKDEASVRRVAEKLKMDWAQAKFCSVALLYKEQYGTPEAVTNAMPKIMFSGENPFQEG